MEENKYLFIGGSKDGQLLTIHEGDQIEFPILESWNQQICKKELYRKEVFLISAGKYIKPCSFFIFEQLTIRQASKLILPALEHSSLISKMKSDERILLEKIKKEGVVLGHFEDEKRKRTIQIIQELGMNHKRANYILLKWSGKDWYDYGVSVGYGWLTKKGFQLDENPL